MQVEDFNGKILGIKLLWKIADVRLDKKASVGIWTLARTRSGCTHNFLS